MRYGGVQRIKFDVHAAVYMTERIVTTRFDRSK